MAVKSLISDSIVESVKHAIKSSSSFSDSTVSSLQILLGLNGKANVDGSSNDRRKVLKSTGSNTTPTRLKALRSTRARTAAKAIVCQAPTEKQDDTRLSLQERIVLATEVFNAASRALSDVLQHAPSSKTPLRPASPNRIVRTPTTTKSPKISSSVEPDSNILAIAECARLSLCCLRALKDDQKHSVTEYPNIQLEQGACILAGKFISLGQNDLAYKELRGLKRRIQHFLEDRDFDRNGDIHKAKTKSARHEEAVKETMADLTHFTHLDNAESLLGLLVSFQANVMRLIASEKRASIVGKICDVLVRSNSSSPANIISMALKSGHLSKDKAALQLISLSNTIYALSPVVERSTKQTGSVSRSHISPITSLTLQLLSLEIRSMSWTLSGHICEPTKEISDPIARYLACFMRNCHKIDKTEFVAIYESVLGLKKFAEGGEQQLTLQAPESWKITTCLGKIAQDAGYIHEALILFGDALKTCLDVPLAVSAIRCRVASLHFHSVKSSKGPDYPLVESLLEASGALKTSFKGSSDDLEELLVEAAKLKKVAMAFFSNSLSETGENRNISDEVRASIIEYLHGFIRFLRRYLGRCPTDDNDAKGELFQQLVCKTKNIVLAAINSVVAVGKVAVVSETLVWEETLHLLVDCKRLLALLSCADAENTESLLPENWRMSMVKLSNIFWSQYLKEKETGKESAELLPLLEQSTSLLRNCPLTERTAGFAALKFERLAQLCSEANMCTKAELALRQSIQEHIDSGTLEQVTIGLANRPPYRVCQNPKSKGYILNRVLSAHLKVALRLKRHEQVFFDKSLGPDQRGTMLEWQLGLLVECRGCDSNNEIFRSVLNLLLSELLGIYAWETYPIHRLRVVLCALRFLLEHPNTMDSSTVELLKQEATTGLSKDVLFQESEPSQFATHIRDSLTVVLAFHQGNMQSNELNRVVLSWLSVAQKCHDLESLESYIDDTENWIAQIKAASDYLEACGMWKLHISASELLLYVMELQAVKDASAIVLILSKLVMQYCRLGRCKKADSFLIRASQYIKGQNITCLSIVSYNLASAEYMIEIGRLEDAAGTLLSARSIYETKLGSSEIYSDVQPKLLWDRILADAALLHSRLALAQGSLGNALFLAKLSVRLSSRLWAKLEKISRKRKDITQTEKYQSDIDLAEGAALVDLPASSPPATYTEGAAFWPHVASHHASLLNLMRLSAHNGLFQDAIYYGEQALKLNKSLDASIRLIACQSNLGFEWIRGGHISKGREILAAATELSTNLDTSIETVSLKISLATLNKAEGQYDDELRILCDAEMSIDELTKPDLSAGPFVAAETGIEEKMANLRIQKNSKGASKEVTSGRRSRRINQPHKKDTKDDLQEEDVESLTLQALRSDVLRLQSASYLTAQDFDKASCLLNSARELSLSTTRQVSLRIGEVEQLLADAVRNITMHAVYCVLPESTLSLPSIQRSRRVSENLSHVSSSAPKNSSTSRRQKVASRQARSPTQIKDSSISSILARAKDTLKESFRSSAAFESTTEAHATSRLMSRVAMLSHATSGQPEDGSLLSAQINEIGRICAFEREQLAIRIDKQLSGHSGHLDWPISPLSIPETSTDILCNFSNEYIDILPPNWNVISISLSSDHTEFVISKLCFGSSPFLLRLPLKRGDSEEEEEEFTFDAGKREMKEIMQLANTTAHDARSRVDKNSKKEWWEARESLDRRLKALLCNIEHIWLGGFRGIFSPSNQNLDLLGRFASSFQNMLDKHLPSRQKGRNSEEKRLTLHQNVLELFVGLQNLDEQTDPEDSIMDLLYFVVDILQFQGERNAYDEIDFDMMVVETLDILRSYHEATQNSPDSHRLNHTILILDKTLHLFPWESLPCMHGLPVSRMPSINCLRDRILQCQSTPKELGLKGLRIHRDSGTYVLNPSGDLKTTQNTFEESLSALKSWTAIANREPSEDEFKENLASKNVFLYFGHGSGAQYIRGRTIKRLNQCAVTFLMGCSSGCLTEAGEFEPYGTPMNYMHAGAPAVVATLWDVTDKDIDRFAKTTFEKWGLIYPNNGDDPTVSVARTNESQSMERRGAMKSPSPDVELHEALALDEAVANSRDSCLLRYLNGAAPVVYGMPVFLSI
ncbi:hypothetical protein Egran_03755 [Elaphomyces granulatus]|uniref:separase n=1 Tax=Elaphomyces granulatus TaxID=519963 RepID=A0A232LWJ4_9EURO|nr:hypothetical protein Egran_03755 [Elaphomyces granulatus]